MAPQDRLEHLPATINSIDSKSSTETTTLTSTALEESLSNGLIHHIRSHHEEDDALENGLPPPSPSAPQPTPAKVHCYSNLCLSAHTTAVDKSTAIKLVFGTCGIYGAFLWYGSLQEDVFNHESGFNQVWFLHWLECTLNVVVGYFGMLLQDGGATKHLPQKYFLISGLTQSSSKVLTSLSLASGLSFPVAILAKSGKMAPVMAGQLILGGASYSVRDYLSAAAVVCGTAILSMGKKKGGESHSTSLGIRYIALSLVMDGITAGIQKRIKVTTEKQNIVAKPYDMLFWTNVYMWMAAFTTCLLTNQMSVGVTICREHPELYSLIAKFCICSSIGQSFIFYVVSHFDALICSTITTTRKMFSVLLSLFIKGHALSTTGWCGVGLALIGIITEVEGKISQSRRQKQQRLKLKVSM